MNLNLLAPINTLGYGVAGLNILKGLVKTGNNVALFPINMEIQNQDDVPILQESMNRQDFYDCTAPSIKIWHQNRLAECVGKGQRIGFPIFELDKFTDVEKHHLGNLDKIFVCSRWAKDVIAQNNLKTPTFVVPLGVDRSIFNETVPTNPKINEVLCNCINDETTIFLHMGKWEVRKGADKIVEWFNRAFTSEDNVHLIMACHNPFPDRNGKEINSQWNVLYKNSKLGEKITIMPRLQTQKDVASLMQFVDCGIFPARAEGWNLELLEMMAIGKYVICTNFSGHTEFVDYNNARLIDVPDLELAYDGIWFFEQGYWGSLEKAEDQAIAHLRDVHNQIRLGNNKNIAGIETSKKFSWENTAKSIIIGVES